MSIFRFGALCALAVAGFIASSSPINAVTLTIVDSADTPYEESGFVIDPIRIVDGNCGAAAPCAALNRNEISTLTKADGGTFSLDSFSFEREGTNSELTVTVNFDGASPMTFVYGSDYTKGGWHTIMPMLNNVLSVVFDDSGTGNVRIDDIGVTPAPLDGSGTATTPIPGAAVLMGSALAGGAGFGAWRRRRRARISA